MIINTNDIFGKRSILFGLNKNGLCLSSCSINKNDDFAINKDELEDESITKYFIKVHNFNNTINNSR
jgi:hypothetical protein